MDEWIHVAHTYTSGVAKLYVNGVLDSVRESIGAPLNIRTPARLFIGGWYNNYSFVGDLDELRVSKVTRSANWVKLEYENQNAHQSLLGPLVQSGSEFSVSTPKIVVEEGGRALVSARAGGAQKLYWVLTRDGRET